MTELVFATNNLHKIEEISSLLKENIKILNLNDIGCFDSLPENQSTLEGNASEKSWYVYDNYKHNCFADDTGLEVEALNNEPGVFSARYAGPENDSEANIKKVLTKLKRKSNRKARFRTVISLIIDDQEIFFEGLVTGTIINEKRGFSGFGYDPVFLPDGYNQTFAEMDLDIKNTISHRALAITKLVKFLSSAIND